MLRMLIKNYMTLPRLDRNYKLVQLRRKDPKKWSWDKLRKRFGFKSRSTPKEIFETFSPKFK
jgi:hypothetical protein